MRVEKMKREQNRGISEVTRRWRNEERRERGSEVVRAGGRQGSMQEEAASPV